jgi:hypothetical protein
LRFLGGTSGTFRLGLLSGDSVAVQGLLGEEVKGVWYEAKFVLRD